MFSIISLQLSMQTTPLIFIVFFLLGCQVSPMKTQPLTTQEELVSEEQGIPKTPNEEKGNKIVEDNKVQRPKDIHQRVKVRLQERFKKFKQLGDYYSYPYRMPAPKRGEGKTWVSAEVMIFTNEKGEALQVALVQRECGERRNIDLIRRVRKRFVQFVVRESTAIFNSPVNIKDDDFKRLGPKHTDGQWTRTPVVGEFSNVKKMRLSGGMMKCDGQGGIGYRFDFFL